MTLPVWDESSEPGWNQLPADTRAVVLTLLARLIARGVIAESSVGAGGGDE